MEILFYFQLLIGFIVLTIVFSIQFQELPKFRRIFFNKQNLFSTCKINLFRVVFVTLVSVPSLFKFNEYYLIMLKGAIIIPVVNIILPVSARWSDNPRFCPTFFIFGQT